MFFCLCCFRIGLAPFCVVLVSLSRRICRTRIFEFPTSHVFSMLDKVFKANMNQCHAAPSLRLKPHVFACFFSPQIRRTLIFTLIFKYTGLSKYSEFPNQQPQVPWALLPLASGLTIRSAMLLLFLSCHYHTYIGSLDTSYLRHLLDTQMISYNDNISLYLWLEKKKACATSHILSTPMFIIPTSFEYTLALNHRPSISTKQSTLRCRSLPLTSKANEVAYDVCSFSLLRHAKCSVLLWMALYAASIYSIVCPAF